MPTSHPLRIFVTKTTWSVQISMLRTPLLWFDQIEAVFALVEFSPKLSRIHKSYLSFLFLLLPNPFVSYLVVLLLITRETIRIDTVSGMGPTEQGTKVNGNFFFFTFAWCCASLHINGSLKSVWLSLWLRLLISSVRSRLLDIAVEHNGRYSDPILFVFFLSPVANYCILRNTKSLRRELNYLLYPVDGKFCCFS